MSLGQPRRRVLQSGLLVALSALAGCQSASHSQGRRHDIIVSDPKESFSSKEYGVKASPRVTNSRFVRKGGGRNQIGKPYKVRGKWYYPKEEAGYVKTGRASWYGASFHGRLTANGEVYDMFGLSAAHPTFPLPSYARVTNTRTGSSVLVRVNDRGPYHPGRVMDVSARAAELLDFKRSGTGDVKVEYVGRAPTDGDDTPMLMASYRPGPGAGPVYNGLPTGVMIASNDPRSPGRVLMASALPRAALPGVRRAEDLDGGYTGSTAPASPGAITLGRMVPDAGSAPAFDGPAPVPTFRGVLSYAPAPSRPGAAGALEAVAGGGRAERIEIGDVASDDVVDAVRIVTEGRGRLVVDRDGTGRTSLSLDVAAGEDADAVLQAIWQAGAEDAFVLRD